MTNIKHTSRIFHKFHIYMLLNLLLLICTCLINDNVKFDILITNPQMGAKMTSIINVEMNESNSHFNLLDIIFWVTLMKERNISCLWQDLSRMTSGGRRPTWTVAWGWWVWCTSVCGTRFQCDLYFCRSNGIHRLACSQVNAKRARPMASADYRKSTRHALKQCAPSKVKNRL